MPKTFTKPNGKVVGKDSKYGRAQVAAKKAAKPKSAPVGGGVGSVMGRPDVKPAVRPAATAHTTSLPKAPTRSSNYAPPKADRFGSKIGGSHMTQQNVQAFGQRNATLRKAGISALRSSMTKKK